MQQRQAGAEQCLFPFETQWARGATQLVGLLLAENAPALPRDVPRQ